jgi:8-oxo-dGTP pyrophosphatase MutT (NUDIX family)
MIVHPQRDPNGNPVAINKPHVPTDIDSWNNRDRIATTVPHNKDMPSHVNGVPFVKERTPSTWKGVSGQGNFQEPKMQSIPGKKLSAGIIMVEPDNRVWVTHPTNQFGGYHTTFPKGTLESGLNSRENAIKETHEETGLKSEITGHLGDFERTTSVGRYYLGKRVGGHPSHMGWESQGVSLVPIRDLHKIVTHPSDKPIVDALQKKYKD